MTNLFDRIPKRLEGTSLQDVLEGIHRIYQRIDDVQSAWISAAPYRCPTGCGACCETFEPDILEAEAYYLAAYMVRARGSEAEIEVPESDRTGCILADPSNPYHCTVYEGRPLVCRLFAFCGDRGKDGAVRYRPCRYMVQGGLGTLGEAELLDRYGVLPPAMGDLAAEADLLMPESGGRRRALREILPQAAAKVRYLMDLAAFSAFAAASTDKDDGDNDGDNDNDGAPVPAAS